MTQDHAKSKVFKGSKDVRDGYEGYQNDGDEHIDVDVDHCCQAPLY